MTMTGEEVAAAYSDTIQVARITFAAEWDRFPIEERWAATFTVAPEDLLRAIIDRRSAYNQVWVDTAQEELDRRQENRWWT